MKVKKVLKVVAVGAVVSMLGATLVGCGVNEDVYAQTVAQLEEVAAMNVQLEEANAAVQATQANLSLELEQFRLELTEKDALIEVFNAEILAEQTAAKEVEASYLIDELAIGSKFNKTLSDKELNLFDGEVEFDGDKYDFEEVLTLTDLEVLTNQEDEAEKMFLSIPENGVSYKVVFENSLNTTEIDEDDTLTFDLLGETVEVVDWQGTKVTFSQGFKTSMMEGATLDYNGNNVSIEVVGDDYVYVKVGTEGAKVKEGDTKLIGAIEVKVNEVLYQGYSGGVKMVDLELGKEVELEIEDGDEYAKDSAWEWVVSSNSIGLNLVEAFNEYGEDEEFLALETSMSLSLPKDFATVTFAGLSEEEMSKFTFESDTKQGQSFVKAKGAFTFGLEDYDRVYVNSTGIFDEDLVLIHATKVEMDNTEFDLEVSGSFVVVDDLKFAMNFSSMELATVDVSSVDNNMRTDFGTIVDEPENSLEDEKVSLSVPEEKLEATVKVTR
jgi:hypothetical protein